MNWHHSQIIMFGSWLVMFLVLVLTILLIIYLVKLIFSKPRQEESALEVLRRRYAAGELDKEEYDRLKKDLSS